MSEIDLGDSKRVVRVARGVFDGVSFRDREMVVFGLRSAQMDSLCRWWLGQRGSVLAEVSAERQRQDAKWGGPSHDDGHGPNDWLRFILERIAEGIGKPKPYRQRLLEIAALAVAAIESHDRIAEQQAIEAHKAGHSRPIGEIISDLRKEQPE